MELHGRRGRAQGFQILVYIVAQLDGSGAGHSEEDSQFCRWLADVWDQWLPWYSLLECGLGSWELNIETATSILPMPLSVTQYSLIKPFLLKLWQNLMDTGCSHGKLPVAFLLSFPSDLTPFSENAGPHQVVSYTDKEGNVVSVQQLLAGRFM